MVRNAQKSKGTDSYIKLVDLLFNNMVVYVAFQIIDHVGEEQIDLFYLGQSH